MNDLWKNTAILVGVLFFSLTIVLAFNTYQMIVLQRWDQVCWGLIIMTLNVINALIFWPWKGKK